MRSASEKSRSISKISRQSKEKQDLAKKLGTKKHNLLINSDVNSNFFNSGKNSAAKGSQASKDSKKKDQVVVKSKNLNLEINTSKQRKESDQDVY